MNNIILVGNPNVGKTTLFNTMTKKNEKASNWHGVTVDVKQGEMTINNKKFCVVDLPGLYSLDSYSNEEKIAKNFLQKNCDIQCENYKDNLIINICDINNLKRGLMLTKELMSKSYKIILAVNMINDAKNIDLTNLSKELGIEIVGIDARKINGIKSLKNVIFDYFFNNKNIINIKNNNYFNHIIEIDKAVEQINKKITRNVTRKIDKIVLNKFIFLPLFLMVLFLIFYLTFGMVGTYFSNAIVAIFEKILNILKAFVNELKISKIAKDFLINGVISSIFMVLSFLPQIVILTTLINIIEDMGFMSRVAFMFDGVLKKIGLTGKSLFSIMMGYGCTTSAIITTRNLENNSLRKRTAFVLPFSTCSAKLPIFLTISSLFFENKKYIFVFCLYILSVILILLFAFLSNKLFPSKENYFILEMPKYRFPYIKKILLDSLNICIEFIIKIGTTIILFSSIFWLLQNFSPSFVYLNGTNFTSSILYKFSSKILLLFKPIGIDNAGIVSVLFFGLIAKELIVVGLSLVNGVTGSGELLIKSLISKTSVCYFTKQSTIIFLLFVLIYSPCISALSTIKREFGTKSSIFVFIFQFLVSYIICLIVNITINNPKLIYCYSISLILAIAIKYVIILSYKKKCGGNCNACRKI